MSRGPECRANAEEGDRSSGKPHFWRSELRSSCLFSGHLATEPYPSYFLFPTRSDILLVGMYKLCSEIPGVCRIPLVSVSPPLPLKVTRPRGVNVMSIPECKSRETKLKDGELTCFVQNKVWPRQEDSSPEGEACSVQQRPVQESEGQNGLISLRVWELSMRRVSPREQVTFHNYVSCVGSLTYW